MDHYAVVLFLPSEIAFRIAEVRRRLPAPTPRLPDPHIALKAGLRPRGDLTALDQIVAAVTAASRPIDLVTSRVRLVDEGEVTRAFVDVTLNQAMVELHERLVEDSSYFGRTDDDVPGRFQPTIVVAVAPRTSLDDVRITLRTVARVGRFRIEEASLICQFANGEWQTIETYPLGELVK